MKMATLWLCIAIGAPLSAGAAAPADAERDGDAVDRWLTAHLADGSVAGAAIARIDADGVATTGHGRRSLPDGAAPTGDTRFQYGSITKVFTNLLLAELDAEGRARYAQTLGPLLPKDVRPRNEAVASITLEALATHTSGLPRLPDNIDVTSDDPYGSYGERELFEALEHAREKQPLGKSSVYSNFGAGLLGHVLGRVDGSGYRAAIGTRVLERLALGNTGFEPGDDAAQPISGGKAAKPWGFDALAGAGSLWGSAADLGRLVQVYLGTANATLAHRLDADLEVVANAGAFDVTRVWHVAYAGDRPIYWHNGGTAGFFSFVGFRPDERRGIAILASGEADPTAAGLKALGLTKRDTEVVKTDESVFGQFALTPQFGIGVYLHEGALVTQATGQGAAMLYPVGNDWYALGDVDASLHFVREDGRVTALELAQGGVVQRAKRVADTASAAARREIALDADTLEGYTGAYTFPFGAALTVRRQGEQLEAQLTGQPYFEVYPSAKDRFFYKVVDAELEFERDRAGKITAVVLHQAGAEQRAKRKR